MFTILMEDVNNTRHYVRGDSLYYLLNFPINLNVFQEKRKRLHVSEIQVFSGKICFGLF